MQRAKWLVAGVVGALLTLGSFIGTTVVAENSAVTIGVGDTTFTVQGYSSPSALVTIMDGGTVIGTSTADSTGFYSQHFTAQPSGLHSLQIYAQDRANQTAGPVALEVNITEHAQTTVNVFLSPTIQLSNNTVTQGDVLQLQGEGTPDTTVLVYVDGASIATTTVDASGYWHYGLPTTLLEPGNHQLFIIAQQSNGNQSYPSAAQSFEIQAPATNPPETPPDTQPQPPTPPVIQTPRPGTVVTQGPLDISGTAEPGSRIEIWNNDKIVGSVYADANGKWRVSISLFEGINNIKTRSCKEDLCSEFSTIISVLFSPPGLRELLWFELRKYDYHVGVGESIALEGTVTHGKRPYNFAIEWGDGKKDSVTSSLDVPIFQHRFDEPGTYSGTITIVDSKKDSATLYFTTRVDATPTPFWAISISLAIFLPLLLIFVWRIKRRPFAD